MHLLIFFPSVIIDCFLSYIVTVISSLAHQFQATPTQTMEQSRKFCSRKQLELDRAAVLYETTTYTSHITFSIHYK